MGSHHSAVALSTVRLTPPGILAALGGFDLDPCACPEPRPWPTATRHVTPPDDGLAAVWHGRVWLNPPFGPKPLFTAFMRRMAEHGRGIALPAARTETAVWFDSVWATAQGVLFLKGRPHFHRCDGTRAAANSGCPVALIAYGKEDAAILERCGLPGRFVALR